MEANNINKLPSENFLQYLDRLLELKDKNEIDLDKSEIYELVFENSLSSCEARKRLYLWRDVKKKAELENIDISEIVNRMSKVDIINNKLNENVTENEILQEIKQKEEELLKEKYKIQTEKQELNKWRREEARVELYFEKMEQFAKSQRQNIVIPTVKIENKSNIADAIITIADMHYGSEYIVHGFTE